jgi:hypothetical protein
MLIIAPPGQRLSASDTTKAVLWFLLLASSGVGIPVLLTMRIRVWPAKRRLGNGAPPHHSS